MRRLVISLSACGMMFLGAACEPVAESNGKKYNPQSNSKEERTQENCSRAIANILDIHYTVEDGATEKLTEFDRRVKECMNG